MSKLLSLSTHRITTVVLLFLLSGGVGAAIELKIDAHVCYQGTGDGGNYTVTGAGVAKKSSQLCAGGCGAWFFLRSNLVPYITYSVSFLVTTPDRTLGSTTVDILNEPCGYVQFLNGNPTNFCENPGTVSHTMTISLEATNILFGFDPRTKAKGRYKLPADGQSQATPYPNSASTGNLNWEILGTNYGASIDSASGVVTAGKQSGTIRVKGYRTSPPVFCYEEEIDLEDCNTTCATCPRIASATARIGSVDLTIPMGWSLSGGSAGYLRLQESKPFQVTPSKLQYDFNRADVHRILSGDAVRQVNARDGLADIITESSNKITIRFYYPANVEPIPNLGTSYVTNGIPFSVITIENLDADTNKVRMVDTQNGLSITNDYSYDAATDAWELISGNGLRKETQTAVWSETNTLRTVTTTVKPGTGSTVVFQKIEKFRTNTVHHWERLEQEIIGTGSFPLTNTYTWLTNGYLQQVVRGDGTWEYSVYDDKNRPTNVFSGFKNQAVTQNKNDCRMLEHDYSTNVISGAGDNGNRDTTTPRRTIEWLKGNQVARSYYVSLPGERRSIRCVSTSADWDNAGNLVTTNRYFTNGFYQNELSGIARPDGTGEVYQYPKVEMRNTNFNTTNLVLIGHLDSTGTNIDAGTTNVFVYDWAGLLLSKTVIDSPSGIIVAQEAYEYDSLKRLTKTTFLDNTSITTGYFDCCLGSATTNRHGTVTTITNDVLNRLLTTTQNGITFSNGYDAAGNVLTVTRYGTNGSAITVQTSTFDDAGRGSQTGPHFGTTALPWFLPPAQFTAAVIAMSPTLLSMARTQLATSKMAGCCSKRERAPTAPRSQLRPMNMTSMAA